MCAPLSCGVKRLAMRAERDGDDYLLTGEKSGISLAMVAQSAVLFARTGTGGGAKGAEYVSPRNTIGSGSETRVLAAQAAAARSTMG
jgi:hypothetical protein